MQFNVPKMNLELSSNQAVIWYANTAVSDADEEFYLNLLNKTEKERASRFYFDRDRKRFIAAKGILRILSGMYLNKAPQEILFSFGAYEKPEFTGGDSDLKFNISHSGNMAIFGFIRKHTIGVDIEYVKRNIEALEIAEHFFSPKEISALSSLPKQIHHRAFFRCWTRKEAFIKAEGSGLTFPLHLFTVSLDHDINAALLETLWDKNEKNKWKLFSFIPFQDYMAAFVIKGNVDHVTYFNWDDYTLKS